MMFLRMLGETDLVSAAMLLDHGRTRTLATLSTMLVANMSKRLLRTQ
jgi:hypothetical protein